MRKTRKQLRVVATTALVAAFPVFPIFADDAKSTNAAATRAAVSNAASTASQDDVYDAETAFADFDLSLFEIPDGENAEFYRKRVDDIEREWRRCVFAHRERQRENARRQGVARPDNIDASAAMLNVPVGSLSRGESGSFVEAPADSVPGRRAVALADLYDRLANAPELPSEVRGKYYHSWLVAVSASIRDKSAQEQRDFYATLLDAEKAKSPLDLGRVFYLNAIVARLDAFSLPKGYNQKPRVLVDRAKIEELLAVPEGKNADFYRVRRDELTAVILRGEKDEAFAKRIKEAVDVASQLYSDALKAEIAAVDLAAVERLFDVPSQESAAFYLERYKETHNIWKQVSDLSQHKEGRDLGALEVRLRTETLPEIEKRLAYADELEPLERFKRFQDWLHFCNVEELQTALDVEIARDATSEIDACREAYVRQALAQKRIDAAIAETRKSLPEAKRFVFSSSDAPDVSPEAQEVFNVASAEIAELANDGAIPWEIGVAWSEWAEHVALALQNKGYSEIATQVRKDVRDALADSENETDRRVLRELKRQIRASEIIGSEIPVEGQNLDGTPFDWASYRGAPVLIVAGAIQEDWAPNYDAQFIPKCVEAGLKVVRYYTDSDVAQKSAKYLEEEFKAIQNIRAQGYVPNLGNRSTPAAAYLVGPGRLSWPHEHGIIWTEFGVLFDAEGRVLATSPNLSRGGKESRQIADELRRLFPDVPVVERK